MTELLTQPMIDAAHEARAVFETARRQELDYLRLRSDAPRWVRELMWAAHRDGDVLPDDWRYIFTHDGLGLIACADEGTPREDISEKIEPDPSTLALTRWLDSRLIRLAFCDDVLDEDGPPSSTIELLGIGQQRERVEVFDVVWDALHEHASHTD
jgi:hypothetical protein